MYFLFLHLVLVLYELTYELYIQSEWKLMENLKRQLLSKIYILKQMTTNFVNYYESNIPLTQNNRHKTFPVIRAKKRCLKLFYLIDRVVRKIIKTTLKKPVVSYVGNFYQFGGPVPDKSVLDILIKFQRSVNDRISTLSFVVQRVFRLDHLQLWLNIFQRLTILLESTRSNIAAL